MPQRCSVCLLCAGLLCGVLFVCLFVFLFVTKPELCFGFSFLSRFFSFATVCVVVSFFFVKRIRFCSSFVFLSLLCSGVLRPTGLIYFVV